MAKDPATTRIPRLDGVSRIPLPGSGLRPPTSSVIASSGGIKPTQIFRAPKTLNGVAIQKPQQQQPQQQQPTQQPPQQQQRLQRPNSYASSAGGTGAGTAIKPPLHDIGSLKKSASGERINNAVNLISKRTTTVFKKYFGSSSSSSSKTADKTQEISQLPPPPPQTPVPAFKKFAKTGGNNNNMSSVCSTPMSTNRTTTLVPTKTTTMMATPHPLTRSETFVRGNSVHNILESTQLQLVQSTPAPCALGGLKRMVEYESTPLVRADGGSKQLRPKLFATHSLDITHVPHLSNDATMVVAPETQDKQQQQVEKQQDQTQLLCHTFTRHSNAGFGSTMDIECSAVSLPNVTKTILNSTPQLLGKTMCVVSPSEHIHQLLGNTMPLGIATPNLTKTFNKHDTGKVEAHSELASPITNATYSNPGSVDSLPLLEHVSMPTGLDVDSKEYDAQHDDEHINETLTAHSLALAPDKSHMKLPLSSTLNTERLLDISCNADTQARHIQLLNLTKQYMDNNTPAKGNKMNSTQLLYMTPNSVTTTPDRSTKKAGAGAYHLTPVPMHLLSPMLLKGAQSELILPTRTPDDDTRLLYGTGDEPMDVDTTLKAMGERTANFYKQQQQLKSDLNATVAATSLQDVNETNVKDKARFSFGLDLTDSTLDCSIELVENSISSTVPNERSLLLSSGSNLLQSPSAQQLQAQLFKKQNSFDLDESLGILTPDQMKEFLDSTTNNTHNLELPLVMHTSSGTQSSNSNNQSSNRLSIQQQMRMDQTPSPEELPLDPVEVKSDITDLLHHQQQQQLEYMQQQQATNQVGQQAQPQQTELENFTNGQQAHGTSSAEPLSLHTDTEVSKAEQLTKSSVSKISTSFITSVTSVTSLDTGYQGDGEMSRPASRGACDHSPSNGPISRKNGNGVAAGGGGGGVSRQPSFNQQQLPPPIRRQDPMTDSDFFTESDADDVFHRGDRRAQVIDGQLYGPTMQPTASVFITEESQMEDSCMESSGIFTDVENRCDEDLAQMRRQDTQDVLMQDISPDAEGGDDSTETVKSNLRMRAAVAASNEPPPYEIDSNTTTMTTTTAHTQGQQQYQQHQHQQQPQHTLSYSSQTPSTTLSNRTSYCSVDGGSNTTVNVDSKSFSSALEQAFGEVIHRVKRTKSSTSGSAGGGASSGGGAGDRLSCCSEQPTTSSSLLVQREHSPRKHASLTSLCYTNNNYNNNYAGTTTTSVITTQTKSITTTTTNGAHKNACKDIQTTTLGAIKTRKTPSPGKTTSRVKISATTTPKSVQPTTTTTPSRKVHTPNKWDAVMNKIANNKTLIKTNYNDVKSKVNTTRNPNSPTATPPATQQQMAGGSQTPSPSASARLRRSPSTSVATTRSGSASPAATTLHTTTNTKRVGVTRSFSAVKSPTQDRNGIRSAALTPTSPPAKRLQTSVSNIKRGRSYSKDSQKSSQSDLSLMGSNSQAAVGGGGSSSVGSGSPKILAKTPLRAAKKRDVRNLSISPTDLGPPPKTQQTTKGQSTRTKAATNAAALTLTQRKVTPTAANSSACNTPSTASTAGSVSSTGVNASTTAGSNNNNNNSSNNNNNNSYSPKTSPQIKKKLNASGSSSSSASTGQINKRSDLKLVTPTTTTVGTPKVATPTTLTLKATNGIKLETPTELNELNGSLSHCSINNNNNVHDKATATNSSRSSTASASPALSGNSSPRKTSSNSSVLEKKSQAKLQTSARKSLLQKQQQHQQQQHQQQQQQQQHAESVLDFEQFPHLKPFQFNGRMDHEKLHAYMAEKEQEQAHQERTIAALGIVLRYMTEELDAFNCPLVKTECFKAKENLDKTLQLLEEAKYSCKQLQDTMIDKESFYTQRADEIRALHRCELEKAKESLHELQMLTTQRLTHEFDAKLADKVEEHQLTLNSYRTEMSLKLSQKSEQLHNAEAKIFKLQQRLQTLEASEQELRDTLTKCENTCAGRLVAASEREQELNTRINALTDELNALRTTKESSERELRDKLNLSQDELSVLRTTRRSLNEYSTQQQQQQQIGGRAELQRLQSEADSLRCVLELKQAEISKLSKQNEELERVAHERSSLLSKISLLEARNELLTTELESKSEKEKDFQRQLDQFQKDLTHESVKRQRLSYDNEQLQWQLKQRSEQLHLVEAKLHELSSHESSMLNTTINHCNMSLNSSFISNLNISQLQQHNGSMHKSLSNAGAISANNSETHVSPPTSPFVKGVIEKSESVSWVLEMDDETPEAAASKMVKRAGSMRTSNERSLKSRRQFSVSASAVSAGNTSNTNTGNTNDNGPNPLSQSMSAASVILQHSNEGSPEQGSRILARTRSHSVCLKNSDNNTHAAGSASASATTTATTTPAKSYKSLKKYQRQLSCGSSSTRKPHDMLADDWNEPILPTSSPYNGSMRPRCSTMMQQSQTNGGTTNGTSNDDLFYRSKSNNLITCDSSALNSGERLNLHNLPKVLKKCHEIQESAGEAMVSGTNSEDESCSASSDDIGSSSSSTASAKHSSSSLPHHKKSNHTHMSLEEVLILEHNSSQISTPMEVSWSEDVDGFVHDSSV